VGIAFFACAGLLAAPRTLAAAASRLNDTPGRPIRVEAAPGPGGPAACSFRRPICVHGGPPSVSLATLGALDRAWEAGVVLGVPLPRRYDAYLAPEPSRSVLAGRDLLARFDHAFTFSRLDARLPPGCARDFDSARELYEASALAVSPAVDEGTRRAESTALAELAVPCAAPDTSVFQSHPDRAVVDPRVAPGYLEGASLFFSFLDDAFAKEPGALVTSSLALAPTRTPVASDRWNDEPDPFDVLRASLKDAMGDGTSEGDALVSFAIWRAVAVDPPARLDWDIGWPSPPRRLASPEGVAPTGAAYVRVDASGRKPNDRFVLDATWEQLARIRWVVVKLDAARHEIGRVEAIAAPKATHAHLELVDLDGAASLLVVAANVGAWDHPFDPDEVPEPHGWVLTVSSKAP
jgi:hypothetical protein